MTNTHLSLSDIFISVNSNSSVSGISGIVLKLLQRSITEGATLSFQYLWT